MSLRDLAAKATPGPWLVQKEPPWIAGQISYDDARLIALAPELAVLCVDMADTLEYGYFDRTTDKWRCQDCEGEDEHGVSCGVGLLLARFAALEKKAVGG